MGQSALCFLVGRSSKFLQLSAGIQSCRGNLFNLIVIIIAYLSFYFLMILNYYSFGHYCEYCVLCDEEFFLFSLFFCSSVSGIRSVFINWVCWVPGNFSGEPGHVYFVCVSPLCGVPCRYNFIGYFGGVGGGTVRIFLSSGSAVAGTVR